MAATFVLFASLPDAVPEDYKRFLVNALIPTALSFDSAKGFPNRLKCDSLRARQRRQGWQERSRSRGGR